MKLKNNEAINTDINYKGTADKPDIKIFTSNRIDLTASTFQNPLIIPVRCGACYDDSEDTDILGDDTGDNISERRMTFCEQTVQYWAWKNVQADYYGLFHYRRFLSFSNFRYATDDYGNVIDEFIDEESEKAYGLTEERVRSVVEKYDIVIPKRLDVTSFPEHPKSVWEHWCNAPSLKEDDLKTLLSVIGKMQPNYYKTAKKYLKGKHAYFCGMHIMKSEIFHEYCQWLYPMLFELEREIDISTYSLEGQRTVGHLAERLLGIFIMHIKETRPEVRIKELQMVMFLKPEAMPKKFKPAFNTKTVVPVVLSSSASFAPVCAVAINSIIQNASDDRQYDIVILESNIKKNDKMKIKALGNAKNNISIRFFNVQRIVTDYDLVANAHLSVETYYRFIIQDVLSCYEKLLYLDSDLVCNRDISELYDTDVEGYMLAAAHDADVCGQLNMPHSDLYTYLRRTVKMQNPYDYFQAGVLLFNIKEMKKAYDLKEWFTFAQKGYRYCDQDVLNRYCQGNVKYLDMKWNVLIDCANHRVPVLIKAAPGDINSAYHKARKNPYIVHFAGFQKPWNQRAVDFEDEFWKYARSTPYYEEFMVRVTVNEVLAAAKTQIPPIGVKQALKNAIKEKARKWCPVGTWRFKIAKKVLRLYRKIFGK